jgi:hypothetical protein
LNREKVRTAQREYKRANPQIDKAWKEANAERWAEYQASYREERKLAARAASKAWYEANKEKVAERNKAKRLEASLRAKKDKK